MISIIVSIVVGIVLYFLNRASKKAVYALDNGKYFLRMNPLYQLVGLAGIVMSTVVLFMPVMADEYSIEIFIATGALFLLIFGASMPCFLWYRNHTLFFDDTQIVSRDAYGNMQTIYWQNVQKIQFKSFWGVLEVQDDKGNVAKAHQHLVGFSTFIDELKINSSKHRFSSNSISNH